MNMDHTACHIIFCDRRAKANTLICREDTKTSSSEGRLGAQISALPAPSEVRENVRIILAAFQEVFLCHSGIACSNRLRELEDSRQNGVPVVVFLDIDPQVDFGHRLSRDTTLLRPGIRPPEEGLDEYYGITLLKHLAAESHSDGIGNLVVPIAVIRDGRRLSSQSLGEELYVTRLCESLLANIEASKSFQLVDPRLLMKCLDAGATDAFNSPLTADRLQQIIVAAYKAHLQHIKERPRQLDLKRIRKRSWVGVEEERPYAYLREAMVSSLMSSICRPEAAALGVNVNIDAFQISSERRATIESAIGSWSFSAHDFTDDELLHGAYLILSHCLQMPELEHWRLTEHELRAFLVASRAAYNSFVLYHNFRHVVDVLQALFFSLLQVGALPKYPSAQNLPRNIPTSPISKLLGPFDALVLLVSAIGHDVGHPGVNNAFLVTLKAPLAQLYNDKSVLEAFHCAAYSQILRRHWKRIYDDVEFRRLLINTILATDMGVHPDYMANLGNLQGKLHHEGGTDSWAAKVVQTNKDLALGLLIKCADISNVARPFDTAVKWAQILQQEFAKQGEMEQDVGMNSVLFGGPPELGNMTKLANSQVGFMNFFGLPLFEGVADIMPELQYAVDEIIKNKSVWESRIGQEKRKEDVRLEKRLYHSEGTQSPRSASPDKAYFSISPIATHPEGLPASGISSDDLKEKEDTTTSQLPQINRISLLDGADDFFTPPASPRAVGILPQDGRRKQHQTPDVAHASAALTAGVRNLVPAEIGGTIITKPSGVLKASQSPEATAAFSRQVVETPSRSGSQNFSRPYSQHHSAQASCTATRSSASRAPTFSSVNYPASPTETQATSLGEDSDLSSFPQRVDAAGRPHTSNSGSITMELSDDGPSRSSRASVGAMSEVQRDRTQYKTRPLTSGVTATKLQRDGYSKEPAVSARIKRKSSRWKFDFWRRKRQAEKEAQMHGEAGSVSPTDPS